jgi:hypothetical protein
VAKPVEGILGHGRLESRVIVAGRETTRALVHFTGAMKVDESPWFVTFVCEMSRLNP